MPSWLMLLLAASIVVLAGILVGALILPAETPIEGGEVVPAAGVSKLVYPASLVGEIAQPIDDGWELPAASVTVGNATFVIDSGNSRILKLNDAGHIIATFDSASSGRLTLKQPMAIASDGKRIVVANSRIAELLVLDLDLSPTSLQILPLTSASGETAPRPIGVAVTQDGGFVVSDADNHRVLRLDDQGHAVWTAGTGSRAGGQDGFNVPGAVALDGSGNIYVVDVLNGRVVKLSPDGAYVRQFGQLGDTAGMLSRPKGVAVDDDGRVFVSDGLLTAVQVFAPDGGYLGLIGRRDPADPASASLFQAPAGLSFAGGQLLVTDRFMGLLTFELAGASLPEPEGE